jgi:hypothetical protein
MFLIVQMLIVRQLRFYTQCIAYLYLLHEHRDKHGKPLD